MRLISVDPGTFRTGWAVLNDTDLIASGCLHPPGQSWQSRVAIIKLELERLCQLHEVAHAAVEWNVEKLSGTTGKSHETLLTGTACMIGYFLHQFWPHQCYLIAPRQWKGVNSKSKTMFDVGMLYPGVVPPHQSSAKVEFERHSDRCDAILMGRLFIDWSKLMEGAHQDWRKMLHDKKTKMYRL